MRIDLVVPPSRPIAAALETIEGWAAKRGFGIVQLRPDEGVRREVAAAGVIEPGDLVVALGGDGTVLSALRAATPADAPVLGVACGSLGALTAVDADGVEQALERVHSGDWTARRLPALAIHPAHGPDAWAVNDFVVARRGGGQVGAEVSVDGELYARLAGDGLIVATPLGSSAYSMAAGGPLLVAGTPAVVCTPLAMHGGSAPPLIVPSTLTLRVTVHPGWGGFDVEVDGHLQELEAREYDLCLHEDKLTLVTFGQLGLGLTALRDRGLIADS